MARAVEGQDYLVDHYAVLGVARDATPEEIRQAYVTAVPGFHSDKVAHLDERLRRVADQLTQAATNAYNVLSDDTRKAEYDELLTAWGDRPLSTTGNPVVAVGLSTVSWTGSGGPEAARAEIEDLLARSRRLSRFRPRALERARRRYEARPDDADAREDYLDALEDQHVALEYEEYTRAGALGVDVDELPLGGDHRQALEAGLAAAEADLEHVMGALEIAAVRRLALESGEEERGSEGGRGAMLPAGAPDRTAITEAFAEQRERVLQLAKERAALTETRLDLIRLEYDFPADRPHDRLAVRIPDDFGEFWQCFRLTLDREAGSVQADGDAALDFVVRTRSADPNFSQELRDAGVSVATLTLAKGLDPVEMLQAVIGRHAEAVIAAGESPAESAPVRPEPPAPGKQATAEATPRAL